MAHSLTNVKISRDESAWEVEIRAEIPAASLGRYYTEALKEMQKTAKLDGFRPGHAPVEKIIQIYGEDAILKRAAEAAIQHELPELLADLAGRAEKLLIIDTPRVTTERLAKDTALAFTARAPLAPQIELADYKKIAAAHPKADAEETAVSDKEHQEAMTHLRRERARIERIEKGSDQQKALEEARALKEEELPALDDTFVQSLGYENAEKFSETLRANIKTEKELRAREKRRAAILENLVKESRISYPAILREHELDDMEAHMSAQGGSLPDRQADTSGGKDWFETYLKQIKKTREQVRGEWKAAADSRAKVRLILSEIARKESIEPDEKELDKELLHARKHYPDANENLLRAHIAHAMRNEKTLQFLEGNTEPTGHTEHTR